MKVKLNYYLILNIPQTAGEKEIRNAYLRLVKKYHPDKNKGNKLAERKFKQINTAYQILQDPEKRKTFDKEWQLLQQKSNEKKSAEQKKKSPHKPQKKKDSQKKLDSSLNFMRTFFKAGRKEKPIDLEIPLLISLKDLCQISSKTVTYSKPYNGGLKKSSFQVQIPKGSQPGKRLHFKNKGGSNGKKIYGSLFLKLQLDFNSLFKVKDYDIYLSLPIKFTEAFKGNKKKVPSPYGTILLTIPPKTKHNHIFRFKNLGLPKASGLKGCMFVKIFVDYPQEKRIKIQNEMKNLSEKNKRAYIEQYENQKDVYKKVLDFEKTLKSDRSNG